MLFIYSTTGGISKSGRALKKAVVKLFPGDTLVTINYPPKKTKIYTLVVVKSPALYLSQISAADSRIQSLCLTGKL